METRMNNEIEMLRQGLTGQQPVDEAVLTSAAVLSDRLDMLKRSSPLFEAVSFSPEVEGMMAVPTAVASTKGEMILGPDRFFNGAVFDFDDRNVPN